MKFIKLISLSLITILQFSCNRQIFSTNGETIYKTGKNLKGEKMLDKKASRITIVNSCKTCHGKNGDAMQKVSIKFSYLSNRNNFTIPYTDSLLYRFLDNDIKSDGTKANIGVIWKMNDQDKKDLLEYLKTL
ncbi:c-type cytochrome [Flavobacterium marginilacus]|uniref:c-type cytochrome n=1 Tax=Flavobacterium marginilacus TaxID=3003256 RepID=UPI00248E9468|nr:c-type cytochrome [Flavobacterium marginilacus]